MDDVWEGLGWKRSECVRCLGRVGMEKEKASEVKKMYSGENKGNL